jgi:hypothetical protein
LVWLVSLSQTPVCVLFFQNFQSYSSNNNKKGGDGRTDTITSSTTKASSITTFILPAGAAQLSHWLAGFCSIFLLASFKKLYKYLFIYLSLSFFHKIDIDMR